MVLRLVRVLVARIEHQGEIARDYGRDAPEMRRVLVARIEHQGEIARDYGRDAPEMCRVLVARIEHQGEIVRDYGRDAPEMSLIARTGSYYCAGGSPEFGRPLSSGSAYRYYLPTCSYCADGAQLTRPDAALLPWISRRRITADDPRPYLSLLPRALPTPGTRDSPRS